MIWDKLPTAIILFLSISCCPTLALHHHSFTLLGWFGGISTLTLSRKFWGKKEYWKMVHNIISHNLNIQALIKSVGLSLRYYYTVFVYCIWERGLNKIGNPFLLEHVNTLPCGLCLANKQVPLLAICSVFNEFCQIWFRNRLQKSIFILIFHLYQSFYRNQQMENHFNYT